MDPNVKRLLTVASRCLTELPSRDLDCDIYCAVHNILDGNDQRNAAMVEAHQRGQVLLLNEEGDEASWVEVPPFSIERKYAEMLLPDGLLTICQPPLRVCATALKARAILDGPPISEAQTLRYA
jgi:hypothetical protein